MRLAISWDSAWRPHPHRPTVPAQLNVSFNLLPLSAAEAEEPAYAECERRRFNRDTITLSAPHAAPAPGRASAPGPGPLPVAQLEH